MILKDLEIVGEGFSINRKISEGLTRKNAASGPICAALSLREAR